MNFSPINFYILFRKYNQRSKHFTKFGHEDVLRWSLIALMKEIGTWFIERAFLWFSLTFRTGMPLLYL